MSLAGLIAHRGSIATTRRATRSEGTDGASALAWADIAEGVRILLAPETSAQLQRIFGAETRGTWHGWVTPDVDAQLGDGVIVTAGAYVGDRLRVTAVLPLSLGASPHRELALELTPEAFS